MAGIERSKSAIGGNGRRADAGAAQAIDPQLPVEVSSLRNHSEKADLEFAEEAGGQRSYFWAPIVFCASSHFHFSDNLIQFIISYII